MRQGQPEDRSDQDRRCHQPDNLPPAPAQGPGIKPPPPSADGALRGINIRERRRAVIADSEQTRPDGCCCRGAFGGHRYAHLTVHGRGPWPVTISPGDPLAPPAGLPTIIPAEGPEAVHPILMTGSSGCEEETSGQPVLRKQKLRILCYSRNTHGAATRVRSDTATLPGHCAGVQSPRLCQSLRAAAMARRIAGHRRRSPARTVGGPDEPGSEEVTAGASPGTACRGSVGRGTPLRPG
jgi:hypothetical protein